MVDLTKARQARQSEAAWKFYASYTKFKELEKKYAKLKSTFEKDMLVLFDDMGVKRIRFYKSADGSCLPHVGVGPLVVTKCEKTQVVWNVAKLKRKLSKKKLAAILRKEYTITDMAGLSTYLRTCGVDPIKFKQYLAVKEEVDMTKLEQLSSLGYLTVADIDNCYDVQTSKPYFTFSVKRDDADDEQR